ncbi:DEAD/DEAH box helicase [Nocardioides daejeonensis]|uniref:DEAD/DEAH box helicase n=1 Tax=Nocardioides daejeonensis TaxID=1046556 RepID=UPI000D746759|nr:DEAD/DEAH box helicase [Nocardioides daejeonensis]
MSFVPVLGPATFHPQSPPRLSEVEFTGAERTVQLGMRAALPVLSRARADDDAHESVRLLAGAALLAMQVVAAGGLAPGDDVWQPVLSARDEDRVRSLATARAGDLGVAEAEQLVRGVLAAVVDSLPQARPTAPRARAEPAKRRSGDFTRRLQSRLDRHTSALDRPHLVRIALRVEAPEEELVAGAVTLVLQVHDAQNPLHVTDAAVLFTEDGEVHGFGDRARVHTGVALREAAAAWPPLERFSELRVPDRITLDTDEILDFLDHGVTALTDRGVDVHWPRSLNRDVTSRAVLRPGKEDLLNDGLFGPESLFSFNWQLALHGETLTDAEMEILAAAATPLVKLRDQWVVVDSATLKRARKRMIRTVKPSQALAATLTGVVQVDETDTEVVVGASLERVRERLRGAAVRDPLPPPPSLAAELRDYQRQGVTWLAELTSMGLGACLADDMGLGKTITLIALHLHRHAAGVGGPTLVVCPASLLGNWEAEIRRFAPGTEVRRFHGPGRTLEGVRDGFVLTTYQTMRADAESLAKVPWDLVVADEAQHVKNAQSSTARSLRKVPSRARVALTGTPVENNLTELWAILDWATPGLLGSRQAFRKVWAAPIEAGVDPAVNRRFADLVQPFLLRRRKSDPGIAPELPPKTETDHLLSLGREQVVLYETLVRTSMEKIAEADEEARRGLVLALLTGLKQICNHPAHYLKQADPRMRGRSEKVELLDELVEVVLREDGAVLVFTQYVAMARLLERHLTAAGVPVQLLHGGTPVPERERMVERFQSGEVPVFLLSLKAGGTGLNLTRADHVVHFDRWWNPAVEDQATDRAYRIGQTKPVQVHRLVTQGTVEERIAELLQRKRALADSVLGRGEAALTELSDAELMDLVQLRRDDARRYGEDRTTDDRAVGGR